jgi:putative inorganic carbon (hco3(-)) transporter
VTRARWTLPWLGAAGAGLMAVAAGAAISQRTGAVEGYQAAAVLAALFAAAVLVATVEPAVTISAGIALSVFAGQFDRLGSPIGLDRVTLVAGILAALIRDARSEQPRLRTRGVHLLLLAILAWTVYSALFAGTLTQKAPFFALLDYLGIVPFALFWVAPAAFPGPRERRILLTMLVGVGLYLGATAFLETIGPSALVFPRYIMDPNVGIHFGRARGPFVEAAGNGLSLYLCAVAAAIAIPQWRRKWIPIAALVLCVIGVVFCVTRQIWLGGIAGTIVAMLSHRRLRPWLVATAAIGVIGVVALLAFVPGFQAKATMRLNDQKPVWDRLNSNDAALRMTGERPLTGFGWYAFARDSDPYYRLADDRALTVVARPHNVLLSYGAELGLPLLIAWLAALAIAIGGGARRRGPPDLDHWRTGLLAVACCWMAVANFSPMGYAFDHAMLWLWAGLTWSRS